MADFTVSYTRVNSNIVRATLTTTGTAKTVPIIPIIVLDVSGSMSGSRLKNCIKAIQHVLNKVGKIRLITYHSLAVDNGFVNQLPCLKADGMTSFRAAYERIISVMGKEFGPFQVIFLTDGEDTCRKGLVDGDRAWLKEQLVGKNCVIHTIGIECESHTQHMLELSRCGSSEGTYGYFNTTIENSYVEEADRLVELLGCLTEVEFEGKKYFIGSEPVVVYLQDQERVCENAGTTSEEIDYLAYKANELVRQGTNAALTEIQSLRDQAQQIFNEAGKQPRITRKLLRDRLTPIHNLINEFYQMAHTRTITHDKLARLNVAARDARSDRFAKKVVDRTDQNVAIIEREDQELLGIVDAMANVQLDDQPTDMTCALSCMNSAELLRDGDCLGIGVRALVKETCIVDPTLLRIEGISTSHFGCAAFLEAAEYAAKNTNLQYGNATNVVVDSSREPVSGVLPLYLNETHWKVAKLYLRRMAGHLCCKDPMLGTNRIVFYTYLHVYRYCSQQTGEFFLRMTALIRETLKRVYARMTSIIPTPSSFCGVIAQRMPDVVPSVTLLEVAYAALELPTDWRHLNMGEYMTEEKLRRRRFTLAIEDICPIDYSEWVTPYVQANTPDDETNVYVKLLEYLTKNYPNAVELFNRTIGEVNKNGKVKERIVVPDVNTFEPEITLPDWMADAFQGLSLARRALIALQLTELSNMTDCVEKYRDYFSMSEDEITAELKKRCVQYITTRRNSELSAEITTRNRSLITVQTARLRRGVSLLERVAILHGNCYIGRNITEFSYCVSSFEEIRMLVTGKYDIGPLIGYSKPITVPTVMDIMKYCDQKLRKQEDETQNTYSYRWIPIRRRILKKWCQLCSYSQLMEIMPEAKYFLDQYCI